VFPHEFGQRIDCFLTEIINGTVPDERIRLLDEQYAADRQVTDIKRFSLGLADIAGHEVGSIGPDAIASF
jgi:hypothetical protein